MDAPTKKRGWISHRPFPELAARYSLIVPFASVAVSYVLTEFGQLVFHEADAIVNAHTLVLCVLCAAASSLLMGVVGLFGGVRRGARPILWRASIGIIVSLLIGLMALYWLAMDSLKGLGC